MNERGIGEMKPTLVIPMYNESKILPDTLEKVFGYMEAEFPDGYEVIFSDDGSLDGSRSIVDEFAKSHGFFRTVGYEKNRGKGCAVRTGVLAAEGDIVICTDCDLAYGLEVVGQAMRIFENDEAATLVIGSRRLAKDGYEGYTFIRKLASKTYLKCLAIAAGFRLSDSQCGFKCYRTDAGKKIFEGCEVDGFAFDFEALIRAQKFGMKIVEMPVKVINHRESKVHVFSDSIKMLRDIAAIKKREKLK